MYVYFSLLEEYNAAEIFLKLYPNIFTRLLEKEYNASTFWNSHFKDSKADIVFYLNDDVVLAPECLINTINSMELHFPDYDGIIGIAQENIPIEQQCKCAFGAIGNTFMDRFPDRQVFNPKYKRFYLDQELYEYSSNINKYYFEETAKLIHLHPAFTKNAMDETHKNVRKHLGHDKLLYQRRHKEGLVWGGSYEV